MTSQRNYTSFMEFTFFKNRWNQLIMFISSYALLSVKPSPFWTCFWFWHVNRRQSNQIYIAMIIWHDNFHRKLYIYKSAFVKQIAYNVCNQKTERSYTYWRLRQYLKLWFFGAKSKWIYQYACFQSGLSFWAQHREALPETALKFCR